MTLGTKVGDWNSRDMVEVFAVFVNNLSFTSGLRKTCLGLQGVGKGFRRSHSGNPGEACGSRSDE